MIPKQEVLAMRTGIPRTTISALENNKLFLSAPYALLIRDELRCSLDDLYERVGAGADAGRVRGGALVAPPIRPRAREYAQTSFTPASCTSYWRPPRRTAARASDCTSP